MSKIEETIIVKVTFLGMPDEGVGTELVIADHNSDPEEAALALYEAGIAAFKRAMVESGPKFHKYMEAKYLNGN